MLYCIFAIVQRKNFAIMQKKVLTRRNASVILSAGTCINAKQKREMEDNMNIQKVEERRKEKKITVAEMAAALGMDVSTYYRKLQKNGEGFSALDLTVFKRELCLNEKEALDFLLSDNSRECEKGA